MQLGSPLFRIVSWSYNDTRRPRDTHCFSSSRTGTIRTFLDSTPDGILSSPRNFSNQISRLKLTTSQQTRRTVRQKFESQRFRLRRRVACATSIFSKEASHCTLAIQITIRAKIITCSPFSPQELISDYSYSRGGGAELFSNYNYSCGRCTELFSNSGYSSGRGMERP